MDLGNVAMAAGVPTIVGGSACGTNERRALAVGANAWAKDTASADVLLSRWVDDGIAPPPARRAGIPAEYLELTGRRSLLVDLLADRSATLSASTVAAARHESTMRQVGAQLVDVLAASLFVDDPGLFDGYVRWQADMLQARGIPPETTWSLLEVLRPALIDLPRAERFTAISRRPRRV